MTIYTAGMDIQTTQSTHEQRAEDVRAFLALELKGLIDDLKNDIKFDRTAGMVAAYVQACRELGRLYQVSEKPGGKGLSEITVARMLLEAREQGRLEALEAMTAGRRAEIEAATVSVRESLEALSNKSLG